MAGELILNTAFDEPYLLNDNSEKQVKVCLGVHPSDEVRLKLQKNMNINLGVDICLVIDNSDSMRIIVSGAGERSGKTTNVEGVRAYTVTEGVTRLDIAKEAAKNLISSVRSIDNVSLIAYNDNPNIIFKNISGDNKSFMIEKISSIRAIGNTNMSAALREARGILSSNVNEKIRKVIFLTDGHPTSDTEEDGIRESNYLADNNITVDCLGLGKDINFGFLEKLAMPTNGRTDVIHEGEEAKRIFAGLFEKSKEVIMTNVKLKLSYISNALRITEHYKGTPEKCYLGKVILGENRELELNIGQVERNQLYNYYFIVNIPAQVGYSGPFRIMKADVEYCIPELYGNKVITTSSNVVVEFGDKVCRQRTTGEVNNGFLLAEVKRFEDEAEEAISKKNHAVVIDRYQKIINIYKNLGLEDMVRCFSDVLKQYTESGKVDLDKINAARNSSSKSGDTGLLNQPLKEMEVETIVKEGRRR